MLRWFQTLIAISFASTIALSQQPPGGVAPTPKLSPAEEKARIHLPPGFELQLVASDPDIHKPMNICFDARGRIWMTDTVEYPWPVASGKVGRDRILILDDFGPDGKARKITTFAEGLNIPIGILPYQDGCIAFSIPNLWFLRDADGDGKADEKKVLYGPFDFVDTHGNVNSLTIGFDGWLYACHGFRNDSHVKGTDGQEMHLNSGNLFRMRLDGSHCEAFTRGQVNPFGLAWDPLGNLYSACCHSRPLTQLLRGAVYESFGKPHDGVGFGPHMNEFGQEHSTGLCGLVHYSADYFPAHWKGRMFMGDVVLNRVNSYRIDMTGSSPKAIHEKFLVSDDPWFRPVDLRLGPDGAIYMADFYNCIIGHYEVPLTHPKRDRDSGRIWRIVWKGVAPQRPYDDLTKEPVRNLIELLSHPNLTVRMQSMNELASRGGKVKDEIRAVVVPPAPATQRLHAMWVLERIGGLDADTMKRVMMDGHYDVEIHLSRLLAERTTITNEQRAWLHEHMTHDNPQLRRCCADALGRHPARESIRPLIDLYVASQKSGDNHLTHVAKMALRNQVKAGAVWAMSPAERNAMKNLDVIIDVIPGAPSPEAADYLLSHSAAAPSALHVEFIARHGSGKVLESLVARGRAISGDERLQLETFLALRRGLQAKGAGLTPSARAWAETLVGTLLASKDASLAESGAELAGSTQQQQRTDDLMALARDAQRPAGTRAAAYAALLAIEPARHLATSGDVVRDSAAPPMLRERVARTLGMMNRAEAREELAKSFSTVPAALASQIALGLAATPAGGEDLLKAIAAGKAPPRLLLERPVQALLRQHRLANLEQRLTKLTMGLPPVDEKMNRLIQTRLAGFTNAMPNIDAGAKVYAKHCAACHQIAGQGAKVGPQLDGIGARHPERLLEDLLDPNRNVDPAFRMSRLSLKDGRDLQGLVLREEGEVVVMADDKGKEVRVEKKQIEERTISPLSPMPANWADVIPVEELNDLLGYLMKQRGK